MPCEFDISEMMTRLPADDNIRQIEKEKREATEASNTTQRNKLYRGTSINMFTRIEASIFKKITSDSGFSVEVSKNSKET